MRLYHITLCSATCRVRSYRRLPPSQLCDRSGRRAGARHKRVSCLRFFFFNDTATTEIYTLSLHDALPIYDAREHRVAARQRALRAQPVVGRHRSEEHTSELQSPFNLVCRLLLEKKRKLVLISVAPVTCAFCTRAFCGSGRHPPERRARQAGSGPRPPTSYFGPRTFFFFNDTATTEIYTLSLHDALPI